MQHLSAKIETKPQKETKEKLENKKQFAHCRSGRRPCPTRTRERGIPIVRWVVRAKGGPAKRRNKRENRMKDIMNLEVPQPVSTGSVPEPAPLEVPVTCTNK